jgi:DUF4097 and DUF4098 domain-containing protein YvlB
MTNANNETKQSNEVGSQRKENDCERYETFSPSGPIRAKISSKSGDIAVKTIEGDTLQVTLTASSAKFDYLLEDADVRFDATSNQLDIRTQPRDHLRMSRDKRGKKKKSWSDFGGSDVDVLVVLPRGSSLEIMTVSGDATLEGPYGDVSVSSVSGDVNVSEPCDSLDVKTASGDVQTGAVRATLKCQSASGDVECLSAAAKTDIASASGDVNITVAQPGHVSVRVVSGDVHVAVARGLAIDVNGTTVSGDMSSNIDLDASGDDKASADEVAIKITTVSGDIRIDKAQSSDHSVPDARWNERRV